MSITSSGEARSPRRKNVKLNGETTVENNQGKSWDQVEHSSDQQNQVELLGEVKVDNTLPVGGIRPVSSSSLQVVETRNVMGIRPVTGHSFEIAHTMNQSGTRPIGTSDLVIYETYSAMGNRPIASNTIDDPESLMGFLD
ncbi:MAG: hypothetical protein KME46_00675 [Brasilonema angustatum HA4187-MV1]|jgi:hypothetical protein|nr:hypothetical protein [Brasilonema angustatum HA4187-MV1]